MATAPPIKTTFEDIDALADFLRIQVGWTSVETMRKQIPTKHADNRKIEAMRYIGLLERDGVNVKLTEAGRSYAGNAAERPEILQTELRKIPLYHATLSWLHHNRRDNVTKTDIANYWHDHQSEEIGGAAGAALTDAAVFFMRAVDAAALARFVAAGVGRVTHLQVDREALAVFVTLGPLAPTQDEERQDADEKDEKLPPPPPPPPPAPEFRVQRGLQVNVEIHIAADAKPATIEEIFKNMQKYLMRQPGESDGS